MSDLQMCMAKFARQNILTRKDLGQEKKFPADLWAAMGNQGLLDPEHIIEQGRSQGLGPCAVLAATARAMTEAGGNLGLTLSWIIHHLTVYYILAPHNPEAYASMKPELKTGAATLSFSVSEPKAGGHPKYMKARAESLGQDFLLFGEKTYLTNGPIARAFIVVAVTGETGDKKAFSAFLVEKESPGLMVSNPMDIPFFNPSPHGGIAMESCSVTREMMVGKEGQAFVDLVLPFRQIEDAVMTGAVTGAMAFLIKSAAKKLSDSDTGSKVLEALGKLEAMRSTAALISERMTRMADQKNQPPHGLHLYFRDMGSQFTTGLDHLLDISGMDMPEPDRTLAGDLKASAALGKNIARLRLQKLGRQLIPQI